MTYCRFGTFFQNLGFYKNSFYLNNKLIKILINFGTKIYFFERITLLRN